MFPKPGQQNRKKQRRVGLSGWVGSRVRVPQRINCRSPVTDVLGLGFPEEAFVRIEESSPLLDLLPAAQRLSWTLGQLRKSDQDAQSLMHEDADTARIFPLNLKS